MITACSTFLTNWPPDSQGVTKADARRKSPWSALAAQNETAGVLHQALPRSRHDLARALEPCAETRDNAFLHAGLSPVVAHEAQTLQDLSWIRAPILDDRKRLAHFVVYGLTPQPKVVMGRRRIRFDQRRLCQTRRQLRPV